MMKTAKELIEDKLKEAYLPQQGQFDQVLADLDRALEAVGDLERTLARAKDSGLKNVETMVRSAGSLLERSQRTIEQLKSNFGV